jgi:hypothetical protein
MNKATSKFRTDNILRAIKFWTFLPILRRPRNIGDHDATPNRRWQISLGGSWNRKMNGDGRSGVIGKKMAKAEMCAGHRRRDRRNQTNDWI